MDAGVCSISREMKHLLAFFLLLLPCLARAQEYVLETYKCAVTLPPGERWQRGFAQKMPVGEIIFNAVRPEAKQLFLIMVAEVPSDNPGDPGVVSRMRELVSAMGYKTGAPEGIDVAGVKYVQFIATRPEDSAGDIVAVIRATVRDKTIILKMMVGTGDEKMVNDDRFMRVMRSFRFIADQTQIPPPTAMPYYLTYKLGAIVCFSTAAVLMVAFWIVMMVTRKAAHHYHR